MRLSALFRSLGGRLSPPLPHIQQFCVPDAVYSQIFQNLLYLEVLVVLFILQPRDVQGIHRHDVQIGDSYGIYTYIFDVIRGLVKIYELKL